MASTQIKGVLKEVFPTEVKSEKFSCRKFAVTETSEKYPQHLLIELTNQRTTLIDNFNIGDKIKLDVSLKGRVIEKPERNSYFTVIEAWKIEAE